MLKRTAEHMALNLFGKLGYTISRKSAPRPDMEVVTDFVEIYEKCR